MSAAEPATIADLAALPHAPRHEGASYAAIHRAGAFQAGTYLLAPGGRIPLHRHSTAWDLAIVLEGEIEATIGTGPAARAVRLGPHAVNLVPPGTAHELRNPGPAPARFVLIQSPARGFDFVPEPG
jgi:quercetin dioxygenase-like cupin family protein